MADMGTALNGGYADAYKDMLNDPRYAGMTHTGQDPQGLQFAQQNLPNSFSDAGQAFQDFMFSPESRAKADAANARTSAMIQEGNFGGIGMGILADPDVAGEMFGGTTKKVGKAARSMSDALNPDRAADIINDGKRYLSDAEQASITASENATYGIPDRQSLIDYANETGNMIEAPWGAKGPKLSLDKMLSMEEALKIDAPAAGMYAPRNVITPEDIPLGSNLTNLAGDQSGVGVLRNSLSGPSNVNMDGGFTYPQLFGDDIWNSHAGVVKGIQSIADAAPGKRTFAFTSDMTPISLHFNSMVNDRFFELFDAKSVINAADIDETLTKAFTKASLPDSVKKNLADYPGIKSPKFKQWMADLNGTSRSSVYLALDKGAMQKNGVPDLGEIKHAISSPDSRYRPSSLDPLVGYNAAEIIPGNVGVPNAELNIPHGTYPMGMKGAYPGGLDVKIPRSVAYPDWAAEMEARGLPAAQLQGSFRQQKIIQPITRKWQDNSMLAREKVLRKSEQIFFCAFINSSCTFVGNSWKNTSSSLFGKHATTATRNADSIALKADFLIFMVFSLLVGNNYTPISQNMEA